jgi:hypothetical protein
MENTEISPVFILEKKEFLLNKKASGKKDLADIEALGEE